MGRLSKIGRVVKKYIVPIAQVYYGGGSIGMGTGSGMASSGQSMLAEASASELSSRYPGMVGGAVTGGVAGALFGGLSDYARRQAAGGGTMGQGGAEEYFGAGDYVPREREATQMAHVGYDDFDDFDDYDDEFEDEDQ